MTKPSAGPTPLKVSVEDMLRALLAKGVSVRLPKRRRHQYDHLRWCFENHGSLTPG